METWTAILIGAAGTWIVAIMAIWGEWVRSRLFKPKLEIVPKGLGLVVTQNDGHKARYFSVSVRNPTRFPMAHDAQLVLTRVEQPDAAGNPYPVFEEILPLWWQRQEAARLMTRNIGTEQDSALFYVRDDGMIQFMAIVVPNHFPAQHRGVTKLWVTLQAVADEADSRPVRLRIDYDGQWHIGDAEMRTKHLRYSIE
jgi:hypothetical protein